LPIQESCPFCPGSAEVPNQYRVTIIPNRYPSFERTLPNHPNEDSGPTVAYGRQGVFLYSSDHASRIDQIGWQSISELLRLLGRTAEEYYEDRLIEQVFSFEVSGGVYGPTLDHPHGQIFGLPFISPLIVIPPAQTCIVCQELRDEYLGSRLIAEDEYTSIYVPNAPRCPFDVWIVPKHHAGDICVMRDAEIFSLAKGLDNVTKVLRSFGWSDFSYMIGYMHAPRQNRERWHFRIEVSAAHRLNGSHKHYGAMEIMLGIFLVPASPLISASMIRNRWAQFGTGEIPVNKEGEHRE
jgi:UDPglucose--hexose-1-phosphate uridylyltransferase